MSYSDATLRDDVARMLRQYAGEKIADVLAEVDRQRAEAVAQRLEANNQWRLDYNEMSGNAELMLEDALRVLQPYAKRRLLTDLSGQYIADFLRRYSPAYAQEHGLSRAASEKDSV